MTVLMRFRERTGQVWLEVDYDGLQPPVALFDDMKMIGWTPPVPSPPPAEALDWNHPDADRGTRYTVLPFRVTGARIDAPRGTGRGGGWSSSERQIHLRMLKGVLQRHAADVIAHLPPDAASVGVAPLEEAAVPEDQPSVGTPALAVEPAPAPTEVGGAGAGAVVIEALVPLAAVPPTVARLQERGLAVESEQAMLQLERSYRGSVYVETIPGQRLRVRTEEHHLDAVVDLVTETAGVSRDDTARLRISLADSPDPTGGDRSTAATLRLVS